jgi:Amt family ammonium transporter
MTALVLIGIAAGGLATFAVFQLVRPILGGRMVWPALGAALVSAVATSLVGVLSGAGDLAYFVGLSSFAMPVLVVLEAAAIAAGADRVGRWTLMLAWGVLVFPVVATVPLLATADCVTADCRFEDFGGALPLFLSASVFILLAWLPATATTLRPALDRAALSGGAAAGALLSFWLAFAVWLASLEGAIDSYTPRILLAGVVGPASAAIGWFIFDQLRDIRRHGFRSLGAGIFAGIAATAPGAVSVSFPWSVVVGGLAGVIAGLVYSAPVGQNAGVATRWGLALAAATAVGFLAPPISGDTVGILFSAQVSALFVPAVTFTGVALYALLVSTPAWIVLRRRAGQVRAAATG